MEITHQIAFPPTLLDQSPIEKLNYFKSITVPHRYLQTALDQLLLALHEPADSSVFFIVGPTGVGKTTLRKRAEKLLLEAFLSELQAHPGQIAVASVEAIPIEQGKFSHRDYYIRALESLNEVLSVYKSCYQLETVLDPIHSSKSSAALRRALESTFHHRRVKAFMIDEAQHLLMMAGGRQMLQQMNWIKSMANITSTPHVLFGTYELLNCAQLSGQLSRRSEDIHLPRYHLDHSEDVAEFVRVIQTFQQHLPLSQAPALHHRYEYLMKGSLGCIGILKAWLMKALRNALAQESKTLTLQHLQANAYSMSRLKQLQEEAEMGERRLSATQASPLAEEVESMPKTLKHQSRVGKRHPKRDPVGVANHE